MWLHVERSASVQTISHYTPAEFASITGMSIPTLHYYERIGLLDKIERLDNGHRRYGEADLRRVDFLKRLRATGMQIREMQYYVDLFRAGESTITERRIMLEVHRDRVLAQMADLQSTVDLLDLKIARYRNAENER